jgi:hypothetical protein
MRSAVTKTEQGPIQPFLADSADQTLEGVCRANPNRRRAHWATIKSPEGFRTPPAVFDFNSHTFNNRVTLAKYGTSSLSFPRLRDF